MKFITITFFRGLYYLFTKPAFRTFAWLVFRYGWKGRYVQSKLRIEKFKLYVPDVRSVIWQYYEIFYLQLYRFKTDSAKPVIIDCGSNVGLSVLYYKKEYPGSQVIAFEPDPAVCSYLRKNLAANNIHDVTVREEAVWKSDETLQFASEGADGGNISADAGNTISVKAVRLKTLLGQYEQIDFLKIDIEGAEVEVLNDCRDSLANVKNIVVEYHSFAATAQELGVIIDVFSKNGFRYFIRGFNDTFSPLVSEKQFGNGMDMQLNVFAYRK